MSCERGEVKDIRRHVKRGKTCTVKGIGPSVPQYNLAFCVPVKACQGKIAVCHGVKMVSPVSCHLWVKVDSNGNLGRKRSARVLLYAGNCGRKANKHALGWKRYMGVGGAHFDQQRQ